MSDKKFNLYNYLKGPSQIDALGYPSINYGDPEVDDFVEQSQNQAIRTVGGLPQSLMQGLVDFTHTMYDSAAEAAIKGIDPISGRAIPMPDEFFISDKEKEKIIADSQKQSQDTVDRSQEILAGLYASVVGDDNIEMVDRNGYQVAAIKKPEGTALNLTRGIGTFAAEFYGLGKVKGLQNVLKPKTKKYLPRIAALTARGEIAAQVAINPYEENLANVLGSYIANLEISDRENILGSINNLLFQYKEELQGTLPVLEKFSYKKGDSSLEARGKLLFEGLVLTLGIETVLGGGLLGVRGIKQINKDANAYVDLPATGVKPKRKEKEKPYYVDEKGTKVEFDMPSAGETIKQLSKETLEDLKNGFINVLKNIAKDDNKIKDFMKSLENSFKLSGPDSSSSVLETIKKRRKVEIEAGNVKDMGDIETVRLTEAGGLPLPFENMVKLRYQENPNSFMNLLVKANKNIKYGLGTKGGGVPSKLFKRHQIKEGKIDEWLKIIDHNDRNLDKGVNELFKVMGKGRTDLLLKISKILTFDHRLDKEASTLLAGRSYRAKTNYQIKKFEESLKELPENLRSVVREIRQTHDKLSEAAILYGGLKPADIIAFKEGRGTYLRTSYEAFENNKFYPTRKAEKALRRELSQHYYKEFPDLAKSPDTGKQWVAQQVQKDLDQILNRKGDSLSSIFKNEDGYAKTESITRTRNLKNQTIKDYLGEITDIQKKLIVSGSRVATAIENQRFYTQAYNDGLGIYFFRKTEVQGKSKNSITTEALPVNFTHKIPDGHGVLSGLYTSKTINRFVRGLNEGQVARASDAGNAVSEASFNGLRRIVGLNQFQKFMSTVGSVASNFKNTFGSGSLVQKQGVFVGRKEFLDALQLISHEFKRGTDKQKQELIQFIARQGFLGKTTDLNDIEGAIVQLGKLEGGRYSLTRVVKVLADYELKLPTAVKDKEALLGFKVGKSSKTVGIQKAFKKLAEVYRGGDEVWKIGYWLTQTKHYRNIQDALRKAKIANPKLDIEKYKADPFAQATEGVERSLQNYDRISTAAKQLKQLSWMISDFYSFNFDSLRIHLSTYKTVLEEARLAHNLKKDGLTEAAKLVKTRVLKRVSGYVGTNLMYRPFTHATLATLYFTKKDDPVDLPDDTIEAAIALGPEYFKEPGANFAVIRTPEGNPMIINLSTWNPEQYSTDFIVPFVLKALDDDPLKYNEAETFKDFVIAVLGKQTSSFLSPSMSAELLTPYLKDDFQGYTESGTGKPKLISSTLNRNWKYDPSGNSWFERFTDNLPLMMSEIITNAGIPRTILQGIAINDKFEVSQKQGKEYNLSLAFLKLFTGAGGFEITPEATVMGVEGEIYRYKAKKAKMQQNLRNLIDTKVDVKTFELQHLKFNLELLEHQRRLAKTFAGAKLIFDNFTPTDKDYVNRGNLRLETEINTVLQDSGLSTNDRNFVNQVLQNETSFLSPLGIGSVEAPISKTMKEMDETGGALSNQFFNVYDQIINKTNQELSLIPIFTHSKSTYFEGSETYDEDYFKTKKKKIKTRNNKFEGGEVSKENPVPNAAAEPSERVNPYTGEPYEAEMERFGFSLGGDVFKELLKATAKQTDNTVAVIQKNIEAPIKIEKNSIVDRVVNAPLSKIKEKDDYFPVIDEEELLEASVLKVAKEPSQENIKQMEEGIKALGGFKELSKQEVSKLKFLDDKTITDSLDKGKKIKPRLHENDGLTNKNIVETRIDIPAYNSTGNHVVAAHDPTGKIARPGKAIGYGSAAHLKSYKDEAGNIVPVTFKTGPREGVLRIAVGEQNKYPMSTIVGQWQPIKNRSAFVNKAKEFNKKEEWIQLGFNPRKSSSFFIKKTMQEVTEADEVLQIGGFVLAKNPKIVQGPFGGKGFVLGRDVKLKGKKYKENEEILPKGSYIPFAKGGTARNYRQEYDRYQSKPDQLLNRASRNAARNKLKQEGRVAKGDGKDVDHKDGNPRNNSPSNLNVKKKENNRSFSRRVAARSGGLMVSIGVTPVSEKQISKLTKSLKKRKAKKDGGAAKIELTHDQKQYIAFYNMAVKAGNAFPEIVASQASLESSHGKSELATKYNNPLGIKVLRKAEVNAGQPSVRMKTREVIDGKEIVSEEPFRVYDNIENSFVGYKEKVADPRYDSIRKATNKEEYAQALQNSGYASDPEYANKIVGIADRYAPLIK